ncbi:MAG: hypothetical protein J7K54_04310 [Candidatus Aenigmarchaeota archaeon]|nr:hypothetical protein [Candidatus Aenigmarchaeota archaeon]
MTEEVEKQTVPAQEQVPSEEKKKVSIEHIKGLEDVVDTLTEDVVKALDIKEQKKQLTDKIRKLKQEELQLKEVVADLKATRDKLQAELNKKGDEISVLQTKIANLKEDKAHISSEKLALEEQVKALENEKQLMAVSLEKTNDMLIKLRQEIESFDEEIKK